MNPTVPFRLYLLRHAKSAWAQPGERDFDRPLDEEGFAEAEIVAEKAADHGFRPDRLLSSTAVRCRQTADAIRRAFDDELEFVFIDELYNAPSDTYLELVDANADIRSLMIVGHNPTIEEVLDRLIGPDQSMSAVPMGYPTAGLAVLERVSDAQAQSWQLVEFLTA